MFLLLYCWPKKLCFSCALDWKALSRVNLDKINKEWNYVGLQGATGSGRKPQYTMENCSHLLVVWENKEG